MNDMSQVKSELKPCPFCGGTAELDAMRDYRSIKGQSGSGVAIYCTSCNSDMMLCREDLPECDTEELIEMVRDNWNKRHDTLQSQLTQAQTRIKEYEKQWTDMDRTIGTALRQLNEVQQLAQAQTIRMREGLPTLDNPDIDKRIKVLEACRKRWQECGETECAAIYQGAAFELKLFKDQLTQAERRGEEKAREELKSKARDHVAERCDQIAQLQSQLTQSNELASTLKSQWLSMSTQLTQAHKERDEAVARLKEAERLLVAGAQTFGHHHLLIEDGSHCPTCRAQKAVESLSDAWIKGGEK